MNKPEEAARYMAMLIFHAASCIHAIVAIVRVSTPSFCSAVAVLG